MTLNFPPRLPCQLVEVPHPGVNGTEPACLCREWDQSKASWKQLLRADFQICMEGRLSWDWQKLSFSFSYYRESFRCSMENEAIRRMPPGDWQWMLEHSCQGLNECCGWRELGWWWRSHILVMAFPPPAFPGAWTGASGQCQHAQCHRRVLPCKGSCPLPPAYCLPVGSLGSVNWGSRCGLHMGLLGDALHRQKEEARENFCGVVNCGWLGKASLYMNQWYVSLHSIKKNTSSRISQMVCNSTYFAFQESTFSWKTMRFTNSHIKSPILHMISIMAITV